MRNPLKRRPRDETKPTLRERFTTTKEKYARTLRVHRALNDALPEAPPAVDRVALVNYASWLFMERRMICRELYPHMGDKSDRFVLSGSAADRFHFPTSGEFLIGEPTAWKASARAVPVLDLVGADWRSDLTESGCRHLDRPDRRDNGERPPVPHGWPRLDAALLDALDDLNRLDAAQDVMGTAGSGDERDADTIPGYGDLEDARDSVLDRLSEVRASGLTGLQVKAKALLTQSVSETGGETFHDIAASLARDLLEASNQKIEPRPDPAFVAIEEARRLLAMCGAASKLPIPAGDLGPLPEQAGASEALWSYCESILLKTVPRTAEGCRLLARFAAEFEADQGVALDADNRPSVLGLIARSPLL